MLVQILIDNLNSWMIPYVQKMQLNLNSLGHQSILIHDHEQVVSGDILFLISCEKIFTKFNLNKYNLVIHESDLPMGRGWSPMTWQILEGKNEVTVTLFEAELSVDSGRIYKQSVIKFFGNELIDEIRNSQAQVSMNLILDFISEYPPIFSKPQSGLPSYYRKRTAEDSELDITKSIEDQFNLLRVVDNERYPAYFFIKGSKYKISIENYK
jgi:methionyl-tRNA formyltransferase